MFQAIGTASRVWKQQGDGDSALGFSLRSWEPLEQGSDVT